MRSGNPCEPGPDGESGILVSVIILNYNGARWLEKCLGSVRAQTIADRLEVIVADNASPDGSDQFARELTAGWPMASVIQHGANLGFCEGNNRAALGARGKFLLFLNNDTWLEPDCLEILVNSVLQYGCQAAAPLIMNYEDDSVQSAGADGFDLFGLMSLSPMRSAPEEIFVAGGCSYLIDAGFFRQLGGFDREFYMYTEEFDLSWRVWLAGGRILFVPGARLHHRGAASVNPAGGKSTVEIRTNENKRFLTNRNSLLLVWKNAEHVLLGLLVFQAALYCVEALVALILLRRVSFVKTAYFNAFRDCWRLREHLRAERRRIRGLRKRGDFQLMRFFCLRLNRLDELRTWRRLGLPKVGTTK